MELCVYSKAGRAFEPINVENMRDMAQQGELDANLSCLNWHTVEDTKVDGAL